MVSFFSARHFLLAILLLSRMAFSKFFQASQGCLNFLSGISVISLASVLDASGDTVRIRNHDAVSSHIKPPDDLLIQ